MNTNATTIVKAGALLGVLLVLRPVGETAADSGGSMINPAATNKTEVATFGAGCFWGVEAAFQQIHGVTGTAVGFMGGTVRDPTYWQVCVKDTGHTEVCQVTFDPSQVTYKQLVGMFFQIHNPTQVNRQGLNFGRQYRSVIFYHGPAQRKIAHAMKDRWNKSGKFRKPIATAIEPAGEFWRAEEYHQQYYAKEGIKPECRLLLK